MGTPSPSTSSRLITRWAGVEWGHMVLCRLGGWVIFPLPPLPGMVRFQGRGRRPLAGSRQGGLSRCALLLMRRGGRIGAFVCDQRKLCGSTCFLYYLPRPFEPSPPGAAVDPPPPPALAFAVVVTAAATAAATEEAEGGASSPADTSPPTALAAGAPPAGGPSTTPPGPSPNEANWLSLARL